MGARIGAVFGVLIVITLIVVLVVGIPWALVGMFPSDDPKLDPSDGWHSAVFSDRYVIFVARLAVLAAAICAFIGAISVAASAIVRMKRGPWLRSGFGLTAHVEEELADYRAALDLLDEAQREKEHLSLLFDDALLELERLSSGDTEKA